MITAAVVAAIGVAAAIGSGEALVLAGGLAVAVVTAAAGWAIADLRYGAWRWGLDQRWLESRHGVIVQTGQIVPRSRVQTLTTRTGPLDRWLGLTTVIVHTAGTHTPNLRIPHLGADAVALLQQELGG